MENVPIILHINSVCTSLKSGINVNWHENIEILHITKGEGYILCDEKHIYTKKDDIVIVNSNVMHSFFADNLMEYNCIIIDRNFALKNGLDTNTRAFNDYISANETVISFMNKIYDAMTKQHEYIDIASVVLPLLCYLYRNYSVEKSTDKKGDNIIKEAISYILSNIQKDISIDDISEKIGISKYHFIRKFKKAVGYTPIQYINIQRCEMAKLLLREKNNAIKKVATMCGFDEASYFSKVFFKYTGVHPSDYK